MPTTAGLHYDWLGPEDGEVILLSAGLGGSGSYWAPNAAKYAETHRVLTYDHRGTGRSERALPERVTVDDLSADMLALLEALAVPSAHIVGHAAGAVAGLALALRAPKRVRSLVMVNGWYRPDAHFARCFDLRLAALKVGGPDAYIRAQPVFLYPAAWIAEQQDALEEDFQLQRAHFQGEGNLRKRIAALRAFDVSDRIGDLAVPTLAYAAKDDMLVPFTNSADLSLRHGGVELRLVDWGAHAVNLTDRELFDWEVLNFIAEHTEGKD
jgi:aminoacrylate hydrolase